MILGKKSLRFPVWLSSVVLGFVLLLGANPVRAQIRTVLVSPVPGNPIASGTALLNALAGISSPSATNRWLLKIEPGIYDLGSNSLVMRSWVDIEGSGIGVTTIRSNFLTIAGADNTELRLLTVEAVRPFNQGVNAGPAAMINNFASPRLYRVRLSTTGGSTNPALRGIVNANSAPLIEECEISVAQTGGGTGIPAYGILFANDSCSLPAGRSAIRRSKISVSGGSNNYGVHLESAQFVSEIRDSRIDAVGGQTTRGISASQGDFCSWQGQESLRITNTEISSAGGSSASYGIDFEPTSSVHLDISGSRIFGHVSPTTYGIKQGGAPPVGLQWSHIVGFTQTVQAAGSVSIQSTYLQGGPSTALGWHGCMGVWDENGVFYTQGCPP